MAERDSESGALHGIRILDLAGPWGQYAGKLLADLGADVIKVEPPAGDPGRQIGPFKDDQPHPETSLFFSYYNTNKRSLAVDLDRPEGREILGRLLASADALLETFSPERAAELGLDWETVQGAHPRLVLGSLSALGVSGPYANYKVTPAVLFAKCGLMYTIGPKDGPPAAAPGQMAFDQAALDLASGTLAALLARQDLGHGQHVEISALEVLASQSPLLPREPRVRGGTLRVEIAPSGTYPCRDGDVEITIIMLSQFLALKDLLDQPESLASDEWNVQAYRQEHAEELGQIISDILRKRSQAEVVRRAHELRVPCLPVNTIEQFLDDAQVNSRGLFVQAQRPYLGSFKMAGAPYRMSVDGWALRRSAPLLGEHSRQILMDELGYSAAEVDALQAAGTVSLNPNG